MKSIKPAYMRLLLVIILIWLNITTLYITAIYLRLGKIEHTLAHITFNSDCGR
ncbi:MAG: hypothetical protein PHV48_00545 [Candidatus Omnitrophica bacterium]|nr:hypothetical protein [Candidatus Omnitrophota bacterium]